MNRFELGARLTTTSLPLHVSCPGHPRKWDLKKGQKNAVKNIGAKPFCHANSRSGSCVLVGGGPSAEVIPDLPPGEVIAVGIMAAVRLNAAGITPEFLIVSSMDAERLPRAKNYIVARHCNPILFRKYDACVISPNPVDRIGLHAIDIAHKIGYREYHLFGFDFCGEGSAKVTVGGRSFQTTIELVSQALKVIPCLVRLTDAYCKVFLYGDGLLPYTFRKMHSDSDSPVNHMIVHLDGSIDVNFDIVTCIINARIESNRRNVFDPVRVLFHGKFRDSPNSMKAFHKQQILDNVIRPSIPLLGAVEDNSIVTDRVYSACYKTIQIAAKEGQIIPRYCVGAERDPRKISITLREAEYSTERNTKISEWKEFARRRIAEGYRVVFVRDTSKADMPLEGFETCPAASKVLIERARLYETCTMNFGTSNGPMTVLWFSNNPFMNFVPLGHLPHYGPAQPQWWEHSAGIIPPEQFAWFAPNQRIVWEQDDLEKIEESWLAWKS